MKVMIALLALVAYVAAGGPTAGKYDLHKGSYAYHGEYPGKCSNDGLYYRDDRSFVFCSNGNSYVQPCAPGTRNSGTDRFSNGGYYSYSDFCDVNLVDYGYGAHHGGYGGGYGHGYGYGHGHGGYGRPFYGGYYGPYGGHYW